MKKYLPEAVSCVPLDEQNSASSGIIFLEGITIGFNENTDSSTAKCIIPEEYGCIIISFGTANSHTAFGLMKIMEGLSSFTLNTFNLNNANSMESCHFIFDKNTHTLTMTVNNRSTYQKAHGNNVHIWGIR